MEEKGVGQLLANPLISVLKQLNSVDVSDFSNGNFAH